MIKKILTLFVALIFIVSCGSKGNNDSKEGTATFSITDSKPVLPDGVTSVLVVIDGISVHKEGGDWIDLPLKENPFTIDLLEYVNGESTEIVPPIKLDPGKYTQLRLSVKEASLTVSTLESTESFPVDVPSGSLKTDSTFDVSLGNKGYIDMIIDFDLSQSLVVTGNHKYKLKPVLHIVKVNEAVIFEGTILNSLFVGNESPVVTVYNADNNIYTQVAVVKEPDPATDSQWEVFWVVPNQNYRVEIDYAPSLNNGPEFTKDIAAATIPPGTTLLVE